MLAELSDTLIALVSAIEPPDGTGLVVTEAEIELPLEVQSAVSEGRLVLLATPPHSRWRSGFLPVSQPGKLHIVLVDAAGNEVSDGRG
jgi:hypothetical protein